LKKAFRPSILTKKMNRFKKIREIVKKIPLGKVCPYSEIARFLGYKDNRIIGWAIYNNQDPLVPCHRVIKKDGSLAEKYSLGGWREQKKRLVKEGVGFLDQNHVNLRRHFWRPGKILSSS